MSDVQLISAMLYLVGYLYPIFFVLNDKHTSGQEKNVWLLVMSILSWFGLFIYMLAVPRLFNKFIQRYFPAYLYRKPQ